MCEWYDACTCFGCVSLYLCLPGLCRLSELRVTISTLHFVRQLSFSFSVYLHFFATQGETSFTSCNTAPLVVRHFSGTSYRHSSSSLLPFPAASDRPLTYIPAPRSLSQSGRDRHFSGGGGSINLGRSHHSAIVEDVVTVQIPDTKSKSSTLPVSRSKEHSSPSHLAAPPNLPGFPYRPPSPDPPGKKASHKRSLFRRRAESMDTYRVKT